MRLLLPAAMLAAGAVAVGDAAAAATDATAPPKPFARAPAYNKRFGFNVSFPSLLEPAPHAVQQAGPNWHIRVHGDGELSFDPVRIHLSPEEEAELDDADFPQYTSTHTIRDGDQIVAAGGIPLASHSFRQAVSDPGFYEEAIKSRLRNTLFPVFEKHGVVTDRIQGYVQVHYFPVHALPLQLHPATEEAREAERLERLADEEAKQRFLTEQRKAAMAAVRKAEESYNFFEISIEKNKKQPLLFDPKAFPLRLTTKALYLREGDELVSVNGVSVLEGDLTSSFTVLKTAEYPKLLRWRRYIDVADDVNLQLGSLQITSPKAARGCFPYRMAKFGDIPPCEEVPLVYVRDSCRPPKQPVAGAIALGFRSNECSFEKRFENFVAAGAVAGVIGNVDDSLLQMVAKDSAEVEIPAVLIGLESAVVLRRIVQLMQQQQQQQQRWRQQSGGDEDSGDEDDGGEDSSAVRAVARVGDGMICGYADACPALTQDDVELYVDAATKRRQAAAAKKANRFITNKLHSGQKPKERTLHGRRFVKPAVDAGSTGTMHFWNGTAEASFKYQVAKFGLEVPQTPQQVLWGSDKLLVVSEGCKTAGMEKLAALRKYERVWVIFARGTCSYTVKTKVAQSIGASGLVVVNNVEKLMRMPFSDGEDLKNIEISSVLISKRSGEKLMKMLSTSATDPAIMRFEVDKTKETSKKTTKKAKRRQY